MSTPYDLIVVGGGAAGVFAALAAKKAKPGARVALLEKSGVFLSKVKISGGGRCNVTHFCFEPGELVKNYPRGHKELLGPFHRFNPLHTMEWFSQRGVKIKNEEDGRCFPLTDSSATIIECLLKESRTLDVEMRLRQKIERAVRSGGGYEVILAGGEICRTRSLLLATGSSKEGWELAKSFGHTLVEPVPSLFTFNIPHSPLSHLSGIVLDPVEVRFAKFLQKGPLLITHFGMSGPAILKLSAWAARELHASGYSADVTINWAPDLAEKEIFDSLKGAKQRLAQQILSSHSLFGFPKNFWKTITQDWAEQKWAAISDKNLHKLAQKIHKDSYHIEGKTTHKEEFVTCGGVSLKEIDFKTLQSKISPGLFFAGEILDIDGITGGFNFQNAWTTGYIAGTHAC